MKSINFCLVLFGVEQRMGLVESGVELRKPQ